MHDIVMAVYGLLSRAIQKPFTTKSDLARAAANEIALCASEGFLTTALPNGHYTNTWMITATGLAWLEEATDALSN